MKVLSAVGLLCFFYSRSVLSQSLTIAIYNVQNLDPKVEDVAKVKNQSPRNVDDDGPRFNLIAEQIVKRLNNPDIIALQEIQDNDGSEISGVVSANRTGELLIEGIKRSGGLSYIYSDIPPRTDTSGGQPGGNIRVGFLYNPQKLRLSNLRTIPHPAFANSRLPLVGQFQLKDPKKTTITVINVHFASKAGGKAANQVRIEQARVVNDFVQQLLPDRGPGIVLGDINDTPDSETAKTLAGNTLVNLSDRIPPEQRYTYSYKGKREMIDQMMVTGTLAEQAQIQTLPLNIDVSNPASDHNPVLGKFELKN